MKMRLYNLIWLAVILLPIAYADLTCDFYEVCPGGYLEMLRASNISSNYTNAHAQIAGGSYPALLCCNSSDQTIALVKNNTNKISTLLTSPFINLWGTTNSHVQEPYYDRTDELHAAADPTMVFFMPFNNSNSSSTQTSDYSGYGNTGNTSGTPILQDGYYDLYGNEMIIAGKNGFPQLNRSMTLSVWVRFRNLQFVNNAGALNTFVSQGATDQANYNLSKGFWFGYDNRANKAQWYAGVGGGSYTQGTRAAMLLSNNQWYHMVMWVNRTFLKIYVNGTQVINATLGSLGAVMFDPSYNTFIGRYAPGNYFLNGSIDEIRIYNYTMTDAEIATLYNSWNPPYYYTQKITGVYAPSCLWVTSCATGYSCMYSISDGNINRSNAHISNCNGYSTKVCCWVDSPPVLDSLTIVNATAGQAVNLTLSHTGHDADTQDYIYNITVWSKNAQPIYAGYYPFEAGSNSSYTKDYSGRTNLTVYNGAIYYPNMTRHPYYFDGVDDYIGMAYTPYFNLTANKPMSFMLWYNRSTDLKTQGYPSLIHMDFATTAPRNEYQIVFSNSSGTLMFERWANGRNNQSSVSIADGSWHFVAGTYDGASVRFYVDGIKRVTQAAPDSMFTNGTATAYQLYIGQGTGYFRGYIDDVRIYNYTLTDYDILMIMNNSDYMNITGSLNNENWTVNMTPSDGYVIGNTLQANYTVTTSLPIMTSLNVSTSPTVYTNTSITCTPSGITGGSGTAIYNITSWSVNNTPIMGLYMPFEGGSTSTWTKDYSGLSNDVQVLGATWNMSGGKVGGAYKFDGVSNAITINNGNMASQVKDGMTVMAWIKPKGIGEVAGRIVDKSETSSAANGFLFAIFSPNNQTLFNINGAGNAVSGTNSVNYTLNIWYHVAVTANSSGYVKMYVDGVLSGSPTQLSQGTSTITTTMNLTIGNRANATDRTFDGVIDEVKIFNRTLSANQIYQEFLAGNSSKSNPIWVNNETRQTENWTCNVTLNDGYNDGTSLLGSTVVISTPPATLTPYVTPNPAYMNASLTCNWNTSTDFDRDVVQNITTWTHNGVLYNVLYVPFEGGSNSTWVKDYSGYNRNGTVTGGIWATSAKVGGGFNFTNTSTWIDYSYNEALNPSQNFTVMLWAKAVGTANSYRSPITSRNSSPQQGYIIYATSGNNWSYWLGTGSGWAQVDGSGVVLGQWIHLAITYNGTYATLYENGIFKSGYTTVFQPNRDRPTRIGGGGTEGATPAYPFNGTIDELKIFNKTLTSAQIYQEFLAGNASKMNQVITTNESVLNDIWVCSVTPNDGYSDGNTVNSTSISIISIPVVVSMTMLYPAGVCTYPNGCTTPGCVDCTRAWFSMNYSANNVNPEGQNSSLSFLDLLNTGNVNLNWTMKTDLNDNHPENHNDTSLVLDLHFGQDTIDFSQSQNNCSFSGGVENNITYSTANGITDLVNCTGANEPIRNSTRTVIAWVRPISSLPYNAGIISWGTQSTNNNSGLILNNGNQLVFNWWSNDCNGPTIPYNQWTMVAGVYNGTHTILYVNATAITTCAAVQFGTVQSNYYIFNRMSYPGTDRTFNGSISEVQVFNKTLSSAELMNYYQNYTDIGKFNVKYSVMSDSSAAINLTTVFTNVSSMISPSAHAYSWLWADSFGVLIGDSHESLANSTGTAQDLQDAGR